MEVSGRRASSVDGVDQSSTGQFGKSCQPCAVVGQQKNAQGYCTNCDEYLCEVCYKYHRNLKVTQHHILVDMPDMPHGEASSSEASDALDDKLVDACTAHAGKTVEYYCEAHTKTACAVCVILYHKNCINVQYIPDIAAGTSESRECKALLQKFNTLTDKLTNMEFHAGESLDAVGKASDAYSKQVQTYREQLKAIIDTLAAEAEDKKKTYVDKRITQLNSIRKVSQDHRHNIEAVTSQINHRRLALQEKMLFVSLKQAEILGTACQNYITSVENNVYTSQFKFKNNSELHDMLSNVGYLGDTDTSIHLTGEIIVHAASEGKCQIACSIIDLHIMSDGRLIVADWDNKSVRLFDSNHRPKYRVYLHSWPWDIAEVSSGEVAVLLRGSQKIQFLSISGDVNPGRTIDTNCIPDCMAVSRDIIILLTPKTNGSGSCILKLDLNGRTLQTTYISYLTDIRCMKIHSTNNNIYMSHGDQVTCMTQQGRFVAEYKDAELQWPRGLAIHPDGSVYVCGWRSNNIHHITAECKHIDVILGQGDIKKPWCICFDREGKLLCVGEINMKRLYVDDVHKLKLFRLFL